MWTCVGARMNVWVSSNRIRFVCEELRHHDRSECRAPECCKQRGESNGERTERIKNRYSIVPTEGAGIVFVSAGICGGAAPTRVSAAIATHAFCLCMRCCFKSAQLCVCVSCTYVRYVRTASARQPGIRRSDRALLLVFFRHPQIPMLPRITSASRVPQIPRSTTSTANAPKQLEYPRDSTYTVYPKYHEYRKRHKYPKYPERLE